MAAQQTGFNILYNSNHSCIIHPRLPNLLIHYEIKMRTIPPQFLFQSHSQSIVLPINISI